MGFFSWKMAGYVKGNQLLLEIHSFLTSRGVNPTHLCGDYLINHDIRIPMKQPGFQCKVKPGVFFFVAHLLNPRCRKVVPWLKMTVTGFSFRFGVSRGVE